MHEFHAGLDRIYTHTSLLEYRTERVIAMAFT